MNERIKELRIQACKWACENATASEYESACDAKFAELIVRECVYLVKEYVDHRIPASQYAKLMEDYFKD